MPNSTIHMHQALGGRDERKRVDVAAFSRKAAGHARAVCTTSATKNGSVNAPSTERAANDVRHACSRLGSARQQQIDLVESLGETRLNSGVTPLWPEPEHTAGWVLLRRRPRWLPSSLRARGRCGGGGSLDAS
jgi:hypothetical protein